MKPFSYHHFDLRQLVSFAEIAKTASFPQPPKTFFGAHPPLTGKTKKWKTPREFFLSIGRLIACISRSKDANWQAVCRLSFRRLSVLLKRFDLQALEEAAICASAVMWEFCLQSWWLLC